MEFMKSVAHVFWAWVQANPGLSWPVISAVVVFFFKPRTPEQYAKLAGRRPTVLWIRVAAFLQLIGAIGFDVVKAQEILGKVVYGTIDPIPKPPIPKPPVPPLVPLLVVGVMFVSTSSCSLFVHEARMITEEMGMCLLANAELPDNVAFEKCGVSTANQEIARHLLEAQRKKLSSVRTATAAARCADGAGK